MRQRLIVFSAVFLFFSLLFIAGDFKAEAYSEAPNSAGIVKVSYGKLNVRASASTSSQIVSTLSNEANISIINEAGNFYKVQYAPGKTGYCHKDYITKISGSYGAYVNTSSTGLNVRSGPSTSHSVKALLAKGENVVFLSSHGSFVKILYRGTSVGYTSAQYIKKSVSNNSSNTKTLNVPSFKQYDSRWDSVRLGNSSRTIAQSGCLTTAIAMERSFYKGYTVRPDNVAQAEKYTSGGSLYWPKEYVFIYGNNLTKFRDLILENTPVIVGAKNSYGRQHWVIIKGYRKNGTVTADDFIINDPGSNSRTTLSSFYSAFPLFYKAAYRT